MVLLAVGRTETTDELRRMCVQAGLAYGSLAGHTRRLRKLLIVERPEELVLCVSLDERTLAHHGQVLRTLIWDASQVESGVRVVGLLPKGGLTPDLAGVGCDLYVSRPEEVREAVAMIREDRGSQATNMISRPQPDARPSRFRTLSPGLEGSLEQGGPSCETRISFFECERPIDGLEERLDRDRSVDVERRRRLFREDAEFDAT